MDMNFAFPPAATTPSPFPPYLMPTSGENFDFIRQPNHFHLLSSSSQHVPPNSLILPLNPSNSQEKLPFGLDAHFKENSTRRWQQCHKFALTEGLIPAPEPTHAIAAAIREALHCKESGESKFILMTMCGHGHFDLPPYDNYLQGRMVDFSFSRDKIQASLANIPDIIF